MDKRKSINDIRVEIDSLPQGGVTYKRINGKRYAYYQWREDGKQKNRRIKDDELNELVSKIEERKRLEGYLRECEMPYHATPQRYSYNCDVRIGNNLTRFVAPVNGWKKRSCYEDLHNYIYGDCNDRVFILYGLRRTGKTTLVRQIISDMSQDDFNATAFLQINDSNTLAEVNEDLRTLESEGYRYIFLDEVTLMKDFIEGAALFSDIYASSGMKLVLSGTDSLGFVFSQDEQLYDRCIMLHTTYISYAEFERVLGINGIDNYIRYGGTMSMSGVDYNKNSTFSSVINANAYVDSAIARNIQHSLDYYQHGGHFRNLKMLRDSGELTNAINRVVEDVNHRFAFEVLNRDFLSSEKKKLEILNIEEREIQLSVEHIREIQDYLQMLDLIVPIETRYIDGGADRTRNGIVQPGLRYSQAVDLIKTLLKGKAFAGLSLAERNRVRSRIESEIMGRMLEDIILMETAIRYPNKEVFALQFSVGEFDMVVFDPEKACCEIYEIKHSIEATPEQYRHLVDEKKCTQTEFHYGPIVGKHVIYRGEKQSVDGIDYINAEEYLETQYSML